MFVWFFSGFSFHSRIFHSFGDVNIIDEIFEKNNLIIEDGTNEVYVLRH